MRPYELLPMPAPADYDPGPVFFYKNFVKPFIPDMLQMMDAGLPIDDEAVDKLRVVIDTVLESVEQRLKKNPLIKEFQQHRLPAAQKAYAEKCTQAIRTLDDYIKPFKESDVTHRTWVVNTYLRSQRKEKDVQDKWTLKDLKKYNIWLRSRFIDAICQKRPLSQNKQVLAGMRALAQYKLELWNRPRYDKAEEPVPIEPFNPGSNKQVREFFEMLKIEPLAVSKDTGEASWGREQVEQLLKITSNNADMEDVLTTMVDFSFSGIIKTNFMKAFDSYTIDGTLHGNIKLFGAKSYRNTSNSPNLLNAPSSKSIYAKPLKRCFVASEGRVVYTADLSALEDRVIANLSRDTNKMDIFLKGLDGHSLNACGYFPKEVEAYMGKPDNFPEYVKTFYSMVNDGNVELDGIRFRSKAPTFKLAYGGYPDDHKGGVITQEIFDNYHNVLYPGITRYREQYVLPTTQKQGYIHLGLGCRMYSSDADTHIRTLNNGTVQFWSILTLIAINEFNHRIREEKLEDAVEVNSSIYDSIYTNNVRDADVLKWVNDNLIELMCVQYLEDEPIRNTAEGEIGLNWADLHKVPNNASVSEIADILESL